MSFLDATADADQHFGRTHEEAEREQRNKERAQKILAGMFIKACRKCDANALVDFAPMVRDYTNRIAATDKAPLRLQTMTEVLYDSLSYQSGPCIEELMQLFLNFAFGYDVLTTPAQARSLIVSMADKWAEMNV